MTYEISENYKITNAFLILSVVDNYLVMKQLFSRSNIRINHPAVTSGWKFKLMQYIVNCIPDLVFIKLNLH